MNRHATLQASVLVMFFLLPALITLSFAWAVWESNKRPSISVQRLSIFNFGLLASLICFAYFFVSSLQYVESLKPAAGIWLLMNRLTILLWFAGIASALAGKGLGRILLVCSGILLFLGVFGIDLAMKP